MGDKNNVFIWLQDWYLNQCDKDWEHSYGIKIDTLDNPGWTIIIDLKGTECEDMPFTDLHEDQGEDDWYFCKISENKFKASCDPLKLVFVLEIFREWAENCQRKKLA